MGGELRAARSQVIRAALAAGLEALAAEPRLILGAAPAGPGAK